VTRTGRALLVLVVAGLFLAPVRALLRLPVAPQDEGLVLVYPDLLLRGRAPNLDFESVYGSTSIWTVAAAFASFGHTLLVERLVGLTYRLLIVVAVYLLVRREGRTTALCSAALSAVVTMTAFGAVAGAVFGATAAGLLAVAAAGEARARRSGRFALAAGLLAGACLGFRIDFGLPLLLGLGVACLGWRRTDLRAGLLGLVGGLLPVWVDLLRAGPVRVVRGQLVEPLLVSADGRRLPLSALDGDVALTAAGTTLLVLLGCLLARRRTGDADRSLLALSGFALGLSPYLTSRADLIHIGFVVMTSIALLPPVLGRALRAGEPLLLRAGGAVAAGVTLAAAATAFGTPYRELVTSDRPTYPVASQGREALVLSRPDQVALQRLLAAVRATGKTRLAVLPGDPAIAFYNDTYLYFLLPHVDPSTFYLEMNPGVSNGNDSRLAEDLTTTDLVITNPRYDRSGEPNASAERGSERATEVLRTQFRQIGRYGPWRLLQRQTG
jgi:hypothetical protein